MSLLTDDDKSLLLIEHLGPGALAGDKMSLYDCFNLALDVAEKALLAKLAGMELPSVDEILGYAAQYARTRVSASKGKAEDGESESCWADLKAELSDQLRQAYAQGAASVLSAEPSNVFTKINGEWVSGKPGNKEPS